jgi:cAMP-dependent protein kinase regulator
MSFMLRALGEEELNIVIDAMEAKRFNAGITVITEGEAGSVLFVVEEGQLDCTKRLDPNVSTVFLPGPILIYFSLRKRLS